MNGNLLLSIVVTFKKSISNFVILPENKKSKVLCKKKCAFALYFNVLVILVFYYLEFKLRLKMLNV